MFFLNYKARLVSAIVAIANGAETALIQGVDLYSDPEFKDKLIAAYELNANYTNQMLDRMAATGQTAAAVTASDWKPTNFPCADFKDGGGSAFLGTEILYNHYANRLKNSMPETKRLVERTRPQRGGNHLLHETLTHASTGNVGVIPRSPDGTVVTVAPTTLVPPTTVAPTTVAPTTTAPTTTTSRPVTTTTIAPTTTAPTTTTTQPVDVGTSNPVYEVPVGRIDLIAMEKILKDYDLAKIRQLSWSNPTLKVRAYLKYSGFMYVAADVVTRVDSQGNYVIQDVRYIFSFTPIA